MTQPNRGAPRLSNAQHRALRHMPYVVGILRQRAQAALDRHPQGHLYEVVVRNQKGTTRGRVYIAPKGPEGIRDDAENGTLLKLQAMLRGGR